MKYICFHGHFYQPPRENPWLEVIEVQDSAAPYHDWNQRISEECYGPNSAARKLDSRGRIVALVNNYSYISFNFGPTLLSWIEKSQPDVYQAILEADVVGQKRFGGHGPAIAQVYNHIIMPLASRRDKITQVRWGIWDFEYRFRRKPKGMWLAETAVDLETLEILVDHGIEFTILAPKQAQRIKRIKDSDWITVREENVDTRKAYKCLLPNGKSIHIFFYNGGISHDIAFGDLLKNGDKLIDRMVSGFSHRLEEPELVHVATDGETFGHHHRFAEMALTWCLGRAEGEKLARITCYSEFLSLEKVEWQCEVRPFSAWSCDHGVERWRSDCGCQFHSGTHQRWRQPLRTALDFLRDQAAEMYEQVTRDFFNDAEDARNAYIEVFIQLKKEEFFSKFCKRVPTAEERVRLLKALEMQRHSLLMFTSCAWFFDDIGGIETQQVLQYAARVLQLARELGASHFEKPFLEILARAASNDSALGDGHKIYEQFIRPSVIDINRAAIHIGVMSLFHDKVPESRTYKYNVLDFFRSTLGNQTFLISTIEITSILTEEFQTTTLVTLHMGDHNLFCGAAKVSKGVAVENIKSHLTQSFQRGDLGEVMRWMDRHFAVYTMKDLCRDDQREILQRVQKKALEETLELSRQIYRNNSALMQASVNLKVPMPKYFTNVVEFILSCEIERLLSAKDIEFANLSQMIDEASRHGVRLEQIRLLAEQRLLGFMKDFADNPQDIDAVENCIHLLAAFKKIKLPINVYRVQNLYYEIWRQHWPLVKKNPEKIIDVVKWRSFVLAAGELLGVRVDDNGDA